MSYDLFFNFDTPRPSSEIVQYFNGRRHYQVADAASYQNPDTGVYFNFLLTPGVAASGATISRVAFNMNFFRPHVFALEAEPEVRDFVFRFKPNIDDPQTRGMGTGPYNTASFLSGWNTGNDSACEAILKMQAPTHRFYTLPAAQIEKLWRWNFSIGEIQSKFGDSLFVPRVMLVAVDGTLRTAAVWGDGIPELIPEVDLLIVVRKELAPDSASGNQSDRCFVAQGQLDAVLQPLRDAGYPLPVRMPAYNRAPAAVRSFIRSLRPASEHIVGVPFESLVDRDLFAKYTAGS